MSGISPSSAARRARTALFTAIETATESDDELDRYEAGFMWPVTKECWVSITAVHTNSDPATVGPRRQIDETITFDVSIGAWVPGPGSDKTARASLDRAFGILDVIQTHIRDNDITLGDTVLWCLPGDTDSDGAEDEDGSGYQTEIAATFVCMHRVRSA